VDRGNRPGRGRKTHGGETRGLIALTFPDRGKKNGIKEGEIQKEEEVGTKEVGSQRATDLLTGRSGGGGKTIGPQKLKGRKGGGKKKRVLGGRRRQQEGKGTPGVET